MPIFQKKIWLKLAKHGSKIKENLPLLIGDLTKESHKKVLINTSKSTPYRVKAISKRFLLNEYVYQKLIIIKYY